MTAILRYGIGPPSLGKAELRKGKLEVSLFKNYIEIRNWLENFIPLVYGKEELGLLRIENLLEKLGNPEKKFKSIHVAGTSGKGTTAFYVSRLLEFSGYKVGLHISPHLNYIGERLQINGKNISVKRLIDLVNEIKPVVDEIISKQPQITPSYFEILVAISFLYFAKEKVDFAIVEVGLGGRLDATNVLVPEVSVITNIGLDHTEILGDTIGKIAREKAGIIKPHVSVVTGVTGKALEVIKKVARLASAPLIVLKSESKRAKEKNAQLINIYTQDIKNPQKTDVLRYINKSNDMDSYIPYYVNLECALLAISAVLELKISLSAAGIKRAFSAQFAGRFEEIESGVILDGAHNPDKVRALLEFIRKSKIKKKTFFLEKQKSKVLLMVAFKKGKDWKEMIDLLLKGLPVKKVIATQYQMVTDTGRGSAVDPEEIAKYIDDRFKMIDVSVIGNSQDAVVTSLLSKIYNPKSTILLITGSLYLVGEARTLWKLPEF